MSRFLEKLKEAKASVNRLETTTLQLNITKKCNQACRHCHVESSPIRTEKMSREVLERILELLDQSSEVQTIDITGGAPELHSDFRWFVAELRKRNLQVIDRCNLTILFELGQEDTAEFLAAHQVQVVASLPCYSSKNVDYQRGKGVFGKSIDALKMLNKLGYGKPQSELELYLVYNPTGASLPPSQSKLEEDYRKKLYEDFGIEFTGLFTITNVPIKRFLFDLKRQNKLVEYMQLLIENFNLKAFEGVMCRSLVSIDHEGQIYDCDFNQMLELPVPGIKKNIWAIESFSALSGEKIFFDDHCFACTAGAGSSCTGATA